jgi:putative ABC transport system permease protein
MISRLFELAARLRSLFSKSHLDRQFDEELETHIAFLTEDNIARGMTPEAARRDAILKVGPRETVMEMHRDWRGSRLIEDFFRDVRHSVRLLRRSPVFTILAALSLAIGIGADVTVFTVADALLFRLPPAVTEPSRLVDISRTMRGQFGVFEISYPDYVDIRQRASTLDDVYLYEPMTRTMSMVTDDGSESVSGMTVSLNYFQALGIAPAAGFLFAETGRNESRNNPYAVLSYPYWQRRFKGDSSIVGRTLHINGDDLRVVGIAAEGFQGTSIVSPEIWVSIGSTPQDIGRFTRRDAGWAMIGGRLKRGATVAQAAAEIDAIGASLAADYPEEDQRFGLRASSISMIPANLVLAVTGVFTILMAFVSLVLLIACANMAGAMLSRAAARRQELAVRLAIGAGRARLVRQLLTETAMVFLAGAAAGLLLSRGLTALLISQLPKSGVPVNLSVGVDIRIVAFTLGLSFLAALLSGLAPALQSSKTDVGTVLKSEGQATTHRSLLQNVFVVAQVAFSIVLVVTAGLFWGALQRVSSIPLGYDPHGVETVTIDLLAGRKNDVTGPLFVRELAERLPAIPGVQKSTVAVMTPLEAGAIVVELKPGRNNAPPPKPPDPSTRVNWNAVTAGYFSTMGIPLLAGRDFEISDTKDSQPVAIISQKTAERLFPGQDPVGRVLPASAGDAGANALVVGVVGNVKALNGPPTSPMILYRPLSQRFSTRLAIAVRTAKNQRVSGQIRALLVSMDRNIPILTAQTMDEAVDAAMSGERNSAAVTGALGIVGLLLAAIGVYSVTAYAVVRRTREIGIRIALGAERRTVTRLVLREGMSLVGIGSAIGLFLAYVVVRILPASPLDVPAPDARIFAAAAMLFNVVGLISCWTPVRRATRIDAISALRHE